MMFSPLPRVGSCFLLFTKCKFYIQGVSKFKGFSESLHIHMVECSPVLQKLQHGNLKCVEEHTTCEGVERRNISTLAGTPISWHAELEQVPPGCMGVFF